MTNSIQNLIEPSRLFLVWQRPGIDNNPRQRRVIGEISKSNDKAIFRYLFDTDDYKEAQKEGFAGFPAFKIKNELEFDKNVLSVFLRRLPPRNRRDFKNYLEQHRLPETFSGSDFSLLAYTRAKLPSDDFEILPDLTGINPPFDLLIEVAGFRHQNVDVNELAIGDSVSFKFEPDNPRDSNAIAIFHNGKRIGYIPKPYVSAAQEWLNSATVKAHIERINGNDD